MTTDYSQLSDRELCIQIIKALWRDLIPGIDDFLKVPIVSDPGLLQGNDNLANVLRVISGAPDMAYYLSLVKRTIEKWYECWDCTWIGDTTIPYCFSIHTGYEIDKFPGSGIVNAWGETEERAGCVAFLKAVALSDEQSNDNQEEPSNTA